MPNKPTTLREFGDFVEITKQQTNRGLFDTIPVGTRCVVIKAVDLPAYDLLVAFDYELPAEEKTTVQGDMVFKTMQQSHTMYLERDSWKPPPSHNTELLRKIEELEIDENYSPHWKNGFYEAKNKIINLINQEK